VGVIGLFPTIYAMDVRGDPLVQIVVEACYMPGGEPVPSNMLICGIKHPRQTETEGDTRLRHYGPVGILERWTLTLTRRHALSG
jgi:hypothetical protein